MHKQMFVNLACKNLPASKAFFEALGYRFHPQFTNEVDALVAKAVAAGGLAPWPPVDHGFMYAHGFEDLDGHIWELCWMPEPPPQA